MHQAAQPARELVRERHRVQMYRVHSSKALQLVKARRNAHSATIVRRARRQCGSNRLLWHEVFRVGREDGVDRSAAIVEVVVGRWPLELACEVRAHKERTEARWLPKDLVERDARHRGARRAQVERVRRAKLCRVEKEPVAAVAREIGRGGERLAREGVGNGSDWRPVAGEIALAGHDEQVVGSVVVIVVVAVAIVAAGSGRLQQRVQMHAVARGAGGGGRRAHAEDGRVGALRVHKGGAAARKGKGLGREAAPPSRPR